MTAPSGIAAWIGPVVARLDLVAPDGASTVSGVEATLLASNESEIEAVGSSSYLDGLRAARDLAAALAPTTNDGGAAVALLQAEDGALWIAPIATVPADGDATAPVAFNSIVMARRTHGALCAVVGAASYANFRPDLLSAG